MRCAAWTTANKHKWLFKSDGTLGASGFSYLVFSKKLKIYLKHNKVISYMSKIATVL